MNSKRIGIDFSKHEVIVTKNDNLLIHYLKKPGTTWDSIKFINCDGILAVTGDYGNWIFCREFHPSKDGYVSDGYWHEKLQILSSQQGMEFDGEATKEELRRKIAEHKEEVAQDLLEENESLLEYYEECISLCDDNELDYTYYAYRNLPKGMDYDDVVFLKDYKPWLKAVFDGFDEICRRMKEGELEE
jgi:hypothetical protein